MKLHAKDHLTRVFIKLGNMPESVEQEDIDALELFVKNVYYGGLKDIENMPLNELRRNQFRASTSNDFRKIAPSSDALYMHILRAVHTSGFKWVECRENVSLPDPDKWGYIWTDDMYVPKWLSRPSTFLLEEFVSTCKCKTAKCTGCKCAKLDIPCLPQCLCYRKCDRK